MRMIDADKLIRKMQKLATEAWKMGIKCRPELVWNEAIDMIKHAPTVEERKTGYWIEDKEASKGHIEKIYRCSACNNFEAWGETELYKFCPDCGFKMMGVKHD